MQDLLLPANKIEVVEEPQSCIDQKGEYRLLGMPKPFGIIRGSAVC